uniref:Uncharacterized protein n=1 Tax=Parascaris equorum TaxID=6256 RepID=A0A914RI54_PAREQ
MIEGEQTEEVMLAGRNIGTIVGIFTMTEVIRLKSLKKFRFIHLLLEFLRYEPISKIDLCKKQEKSASKNLFHFDMKTGTNHVIEVLNRFISITHVRSNDTSNIFVFKATKNIDRKWGKIRWLKYFGNYRPHIERNNQNNLMEIFTRNVDSFHLKY